MSLVSAERPEFSAEYEQVARTFAGPPSPCKSRTTAVEIHETAVEDPRVGQVRTLHDADAPTAVLAVMLSPCVVLTDNRRHFAPLGIPDTHTDRIAVHARELSRYPGSANTMTMVPVLTGSMAIEGSKRAGRSSR